MTAITTHGGRGCSRKFPGKISDRHPIPIALGHAEGFSRASQCIVGHCTNELTTCRTKGPIFVAQKVVVTLFDDIDGSEAAETIAFGLDGKSYEIDLNQANAKKLRKALEPYVEAAASGPGRARRTSRPRSLPTRRRSGPGPRPTRWTSPPADGSPRRSTRRSPRPAEGRSTPGHPPLGTTDLRCTPPGQLESGARRGARPKRPSSRSTCGCSSVVEHPPSRGKAQCAIPVTRSASPYLPLRGGSGTLVPAPIGESRSDAMRT